MPVWNPWHGCTKYSAGCQNCYVYRIDATHGHNSTTVQKTAAFALPMQRTRGGTLKLQPTGEPVYTCLSSDFFLPDADDWRPDIWAMIRYRSDLQFFIITKRIVRAAACFPPDWGTGYPNVTICCTAETNRRQRTAARSPAIADLQKRNHLRAAFNAHTVTTLPTATNLSSDDWRGIRRAGKALPLGMGHVPCGTVSGCKCSVRL